MSVNEKKTGKTVEKILKLLNKSKHTVPELIIMYGNLGYHIGASIAGIRGTGPSVEELKQTYHQNPTIDVGLMLQGLLITSWEEDYSKHPKVSEFAKQYNDKEKKK